MYRSLALVLFLLPCSAFAYDLDAIKKRCAEEWGADFSMVKYCRDKQSMAGKAVDELLDRVTSDLTSRSVLDKCQADWGSDYSMVEYCFNKQDAARQSLVSGESDLPPDISAQVRSDCEAPWDNDFAMVSYCIETQTSAWKALQ